MVSVRLKNQTKIRLLSGQTFRMGRDLKIRAYILLNSNEIGVKEIDVREYQLYVYA